MSKSIFALLLALLPGIAPAQDCATMFEQFREGTLIEYTNYRKGEIESVQTQRVLQVETSGDTLVTLFDVVIILEKDKQPIQFTTPLKCHAGIIYTDVRSALPSQEAYQMPDMQLEVSGDGMTFPLNMKPGQILPDNTFEVSLRMGGMQVMKTRYTVKNRIVIAEESITTAAGTYPCFKIIHDFEFNLMGKRTNRIETWYNPTVGTVKSITLDKRGQVESNMELTKFLK